MDNQDQRRTHTQGHENHGVHVCNKCGWPFPNPHPSAKHRRAHKKICGTLEGYTLLVSEGQTHFNPSDDEHYSEDDHKRQGPKALDTGGNSEIGKGGIGENSVISVDEVFSDAVADFSDGALSPGVKESLRDSLDSATDLEIIHRRYPEFSGSSEDNGCNDESHLIVKSRNDGQMQNPKVVQSERVEDGNMLELQGQLSTSAVPTNDCFDLTSDPKPSKSEAMSDLLLDSKIYGGKNVKACNFKSVEKETVLKEKDEIKSDKDMVEIVVSPDNAGGETFEEEDFPPPLEVYSAASTNDSVSGIRAELAHKIELATSSDAKTLQVREGGNVHVLTRPSSDDRPDVAHPQSKYEDCHINKDEEWAVSKSPSSPHSSKALEQERDDLGDSNTEESDFLINLNQLSEEREVSSQDMHALSSNMKNERVNCELMAEESVEVFPVTYKVESSKSVDENRASMNAMKTEMSRTENHIVIFSEEVGSDDVRKNSQQVNLPEGNFMAASNENLCGTSVGSAASETTTLISQDNRSHHEKNIIDINDIAVDGKCNGAISGNYNGINMKSLPPGNMHSEVKPLSLNKIEDAVEMDKCKNYDIKDTQYNGSSLGTDNPLSATSHFESPVPSQEYIKDGEINGNGRLNEDCNRFVGTTADSHQAEDGELLLTSTEGLGRDHSSCSSLNVEPSAQYVSASTDTQDGEPSRKVPGVVADPIQDHNVPSVQSDALAVTGLLASTEPSKSNLNDPKAAYERQQSENTEMFEPPSFMTLVEPGHMVGTKPAESEDWTESNKQHPDLTSSQAGWFPTLTHVTNESQGRRRNEEIIAKVTKQKTPLKSLLSEAANSRKPPKLEKNSVNRKNGKVAEDNSSGLTTVNSILGRESPAVQVVKENSADEWNSQRSYASEIKREKKSKSRPFWIQFMCCSSVETKSR